MLKPILIMAAMVAVGVPAAARQQADTVMTTQFLISVGGKELTATFADNPSAAAFHSLLADAPLTVEMDDYGGFEKVGSLGHTLPTDDARITTVAGDVMLYLGSEITIFYGSNTWSYTRLGRIDGDPDREAILAVLGVGRSDVTFSLKDGGVDEVSVEDRVLKVSVSGRVVRIEKPSQDAVVTVCDAGGGSVYSGTEDVVELPASGVYLISSGAAKVKVMVK